MAGRVFEGLSQSNIHRGINMISGQKMKDIAQLTRIMNDQIAKQYVVNNWGRLRVLTKEKDDDWADKLIDAIAKEKVEKIVDFL